MNDRAAGDISPSGEGEDAPVRAVLVCSLLLTVLLKLVTPKPPSPITKKPVIIQVAAVAPALLLRFFSSSLVFALVFAMPGPCLVLVGGFPPA